MEYDDVFSDSNTDIGTACRLHKQKSKQKISRTLSNSTIIFEFDIFVFPPGLNIYAKEFSYTVKQVLPS